MSNLHLHLQPIHSAHYCVSGDVVLEPGVMVAVGVLLQADPGCRVVVQAGACIGMGSVIHAYGGDIEIGAGVNLGPEVLLVGRVKLGDRTCIGTGTTIVNQTIAPGQVIAPGSLLGQMGATGSGGSSFQPPPPPSQSNGFNPGNSFNPNSVNPSSVNPSSVNPSSVNSNSFNPSPASAPSPAQAAFQSAYPAPGQTGAPVPTNSPGAPYPAADFRAPYPAADFRAPYPAADSRASAPFSAAAPAHPPAPEPVVQSTFQYPDPSLPQSQFFTPPPPVSTPVVAGHPGALAVQKAGGPVVGRAYVDRMLGRMFPHNPRPEQENSDSSS
jgi:carbon dioxide concentrating mechanism protein CcmN